MINHLTAGGGKNNIGYGEADCLRLCREERREQIKRDVEKCQGRERKSQ